MPGRLRDWHAGYGLVLADDCPLLPLPTVHMCGIAGGTWRGRSHLSTLPLLQRRPSRCYSSRRRNCLFWHQVSRNNTSTLPLPLPLLVTSHLTLCIVVLRNTQRKYPIDLKTVEEDIDILRTVLNVRDFQVDVWFCSNVKIRELNQEHRDKNKATDVLSFPMLEVSDECLEMSVEIG